MSQPVSSMCECEVTEQGTRYVSDGVTERSTCEDNCPHYGIPDEDGNISGENCDSFWWIENIDDDPDFFYGIGRIDPMRGADCQAIKNELLRIGSMGGFYKFYETSETRNWLAGVTNVTGSNVTSIGINQAYHDGEPQDEWDITLVHEGAHAIGLAVYDDTEADAIARRCLNIM